MLSTSNPTLPARVGVVGGGRMGAGIAHEFALRGAEVIVVERDVEAITMAKIRIRSSLVASRDENNSLPAAVEVVTDLGMLAGCDLVVEAVPENTELKREVLQQLSHVVPEGTIATNTSSLSIDGLASALVDPTRLIGLHFFNPVPVSSLIEIVVGRRTDADVVNRARRWVAALGKTGIIVKDSPGFASSRLGVALALEAMRMLEQGVASVGDIDAAMTLGYRHPMGPLKTTDLVGLDVRLMIAEHLARELGSRFALPQILLEKVAAGDLGRKTGQGFYRW